MRAERDGPEVWVTRGLLLGLCAAFVQGGLVKLTDFQGAAGEVAHFGLPMPAIVAVATIVTELGGSFLVVTGIFRWAGALWLAGFTGLATLVACRFWELPHGHERFMTANTFWEHVGLAAAFLIVARADWRRS